MDTVEIFKALANDTRLEILQWLKDPEKQKLLVPHLKKLGFNPKSS